MNNKRRGEVAIPEPRDFGWQMKSLDSAVTELKHQNGRLVLTIEHDIIRDVTPEMLEWWFRHIGDIMEYQGRRYDRYLVWHPLDHIRWELAEGDPGSVGVGSRFRIVEAFGRDLRYLIDSTETVEKLDHTGIRLTRTILGSQVLRLEHWFQGGPGGTRYFSEMVLGSDSPFGKMIFNPLVRPRLFPNDMGWAWLKHNVEEVGNFERFLPRLYAREALESVGDPGIGRVIASSTANASDS